MAYGSRGFGSRPQSVEVLTARRDDAVLCPEAEGIGWPLESAANQAGELRSTSGCGWVTSAEIPKTHEPCHGP